MNAFLKNQQIIELYYVCDAIIKNMKGAVKILPVAFSLADQEFIWT
jgi:hypothetical protein